MTQSLYPTDAPGVRTGQEAAETLAATSEGFVSGLQVGGWIGAIVLAIVQGLVELIENVTSARVRKEQAVAWARQLGIPDAQEVPSFIVRVQAMSLAERLALGMDLTRKIEAARPGKTRDKLEIQRGIIAILIQLDAARVRGQMPKAAPQAELIIVYGAPPQESTLPMVILGVGAIVGIGVAVFL